MEIGTRKLAGCTLLAALLTCGSLTQAQSQSLAIKDARIVPVEGPELSQGTVLVQDGRIVAVGKKVTIPYDAKVIDAKGKTLFPGTILTHTSRGLDRSNESLPITPFLNVYDGINPASNVYEEALRDGTTTLHVMYGNSTVIAGLGRVLQPVGLTVEAMTVKEDTALKIAVAGMRGTDRVRQRAQLREAFAKLKDYLERLGEKRYEEEEKKAEREITVPPAKARELGRKLIRDEDLDKQNKNLYLLTQGRLDAFVYCDRAQDVAFAIELAREHGFFKRSTFVLGGECVKAVAELKAAGRPVILPPDLIYRERNPETGEEEETFLPPAFAKAKIPFALSTYVSSSFLERFLWYQAARCVRSGIARQTALEAITLVPARILGLEKRLGSIRVGKDANLQILSGDPLSSQTHVETVLLGGKVVYERSRDFRLRRLTKTSEKAEEDKKKDAKKQEEDKKHPPLKPGEKKADTKPAKDEKKAGPDKKDEKKEPKKDKKEVFAPGGEGPR